MKQTALEWLYDQIENKGKCIYEVIEQAKQMEEESNNIKYLTGTLVGILAGIAIGFLMFI
jgi:hypothetical protein